MEQIKRSLMDSYADYMKMMEKMYRGGYTHATKTGLVREMVIDNVHGMDFESSYPARSLTENVANNGEEK